jgi:radical SAM superfamily enzyme YgiQ (UPF0313 family)
MASYRRKVLLVQLPIPPVGPEPIRGNVPLAAGYLKMYAESNGLAADYAIDIFPPISANTLGDRGLVEVILASEPWLVGFTCYLWNIERTLWIAEQLKTARPDLQIILGGPEITADNAWVLRHRAIDYAAIGEGEQTFRELLTALLQDDRPRAAIPGLYVRPPDSIERELRLPPPRRPLPNLTEISSPYLAGILDAADEQMMLLETIRGCIFKCKFCYYPKSYDDLYFLPEEKIVANLEHARRRGAREVVLLDPTLNQRRDFPKFLRLLARENPDRQFTYFGELRAEGITEEVARLLKEANFTEVEIGLQSIDPLAMELMDRKNNLRAFERGARAMLDLGIRVKVDLIIGLPGDTVDSVRLGLDYLHRSQLYSEVQVFNLAILPGTAFRQEAAELGLTFQDRPPYYVLGTPTLALPEMYDLMEEAQELFETEFDPLPDPTLDGPAYHVDLDDDTEPAARLPPAECRPQALTLWMPCSDFDRHRQKAADWIDAILADNPFTTLQVVLEPTATTPSPLTGEGWGEGDGRPVGAATPHPRPLSRKGRGEYSPPSAATFEALLAAAFRIPTYLDKFYSVMPGRAKGAKRLVVLLPSESRAGMAPNWIAETGRYASIVWRGALSDDAVLDVHESALYQAPGSMSRQQSVGSVV